MKDKNRLAQLAKGLQKERWPKDDTSKGGQTTGKIGSGVRIWHEDMGFDIKIEASRSQIKNIEFCMIVFELYCDQFYP